MNAFRVLGVPAGATPEEIRAAYRRRARELHPDRHVRSDGSVPPEVDESFCELNRAVDVALKAQAVPVQPVRPAPRKRPARYEDPVLALLTVPKAAGHEWTDEQLEFWALTLVPVARTHELEALRLARAAGAETVHQQTMATAHALLTLSLQGRAGSGVRRVRAALPAAYAALEADLPPSVVARLPRPVLARSAHGLRLLPHRRR